MNDPSSVALNTVDDVLPALPHMLGFYPANSLVMVTMHHHPNDHTQLGATIRLNLPTTDEQEQLVASLAPGPLQQIGPDALMLFVITTDSETAQSEELPHRQLISDLTEALSAAGMPVLTALWVPEIRHEAEWVSYLDDTLRGTVGDPQASALGAELTAQGNVLFSSREDMCAPSAIPAMAASITATRSAIASVSVSSMPSPSSFTAHSAAVAPSRSGAIKTTSSSMASTFSRYPSAAREGFVRAGVHHLVAVRRPTALMATFVEHLRVHGRPHAGLHVLTLRLAHASEYVHQHLVRRVALVELAAELRYPQLDPMSGELRGDERELITEPAPSPFAHHDRVPPAVRVLQRCQQPLRLTASLPRHGPRLPHVEVLGSDRAAERFDELARVAQLPSKRCLGVLVVLCRAARPALTRLLTAALGIADIHGVFLSIERFECSITDRL